MIKHYTNLLLFYFTLMLSFFWATIYKMVRPMLSDHCLSVLSVMLVYCGQMDGWIKMLSGI